MQSTTKKVFLLAAVAAIIVFAVYFFVSDSSSTKPKSTQKPEIRKCPACECEKCTKTECPVCEECPVYEECTKTECPVCKECTQTECPVCEECIQQTCPKCPESKACPTCPTCPPTPAQDEDWTYAHAPHCADYPPQEPIPPVKTKSDIPKLLETLGYTGIGVEVGVQRGMYSEKILTNWPSCSEFYAVDPWLWQSTYDDGANVKQADQDARWKETVNRLAPWKKATVLRLTSEEAVKMFEDESLDFVYVDARHDYSSVLEDLSFWYPKLRRGGVIAGHDYLNSDENPEWKTQPNGTVLTDGRAVRAAVEDFSRSVCRQISVCYRESSWNSYLWVK